MPQPPQTATKTKTGTKVAVAVLVLVGLGFLAYAAGFIPGAGQQKEQGIDLVVKKSDSADPVVVGDPLEYKLEVRNIGTVDASNVTVSDAVPAILTITGASGTDNFACSYSSNVVTCTGGLVKAGQSAFITIKTDTKNVSGVECGQGKKLTNKAVVDGENTIKELKEDNNANEITTEVSALCPDLTVDKSVTKDPVAVGELIEYKIEVKNVGSLEASGVKLVDTLPTGLSYKSSVGALGFTCSGSGTKVECVNGFLKSGDSGALIIQADTTSVTGLECGQDKKLTNKAVVDPDQKIAESNETNNMDEATSSVVGKCP
jgi:uncharacterized repeat protein (TIGR01451 family)